MSFLVVLLSCLVSRKYCTGPRHSYQAVKEVEESWKVTYLYFVFSPNPLCQSSSDITITGKWKVPSHSGNDNRQPRFEAVSASPSARNSFFSDDGKAAPLNTKAKHQVRRGSKSASVFALSPDNTVSALTPEELSLNFPR
jgi:hypothetical protein